MFKKSLACITLMFTFLLPSLSGCTIQKDIDTNSSDTIENINTSSIFKNSYIYINNNNELIILNKDSNAKTTVSSNVLDFSIGSSSLTYTHKDSTGKHLSIYYPESNTYEQFKDYYNSDYIMNENLLFYMNDHIIECYNVETKEIKSIYDAKTNDLVFNYVDDSILIFSSIRNGVPATQKYSFDDDSISLVCFDATNIIVLDNYIYGLDNNLNIFRVDNKQNIETILDFVVLKFYIDDEFLVYIDANGVLNSLDLNGDNRVISDCVNDFLVSNNELYFATTKNPGTVYKTQLTGRHKNTILNDSNANFLFKEIS